VDAKPIVNTNKKILRIPIGFALIFLFIGIPLHLIHWPYSVLLISTSYSIIAILYPFRFSFKKHKGLLDYVKLILVFTWSLNGIFTINHWPFGIIFNVLSLTTFLTFLLLIILNGYHISRKRSNRLNVNTSISLIILAILFLFAGIILKIMHWPLANQILITAFSLKISFILKEIFSPSLTQIIVINNATMLSKAQIRSNLMYSSAALFIILGAVLLYIRYPYGRYILFIGLTIAAIWAFRDLFSPKKE